ncbi:phosphoenolpyruvate synthase PpsA [Peptoclostridium acidaminophilum DSM 3953]|uniref:Phosphoenolpyruvate synthase n=1 Tax=Peptoclostridium acidaminophilum DSM 3953 TaxID=1286171 RepID=W8U5T6_PEPAC|nr:phosphoenolpyruvate synthase [Peptoclostridium acidaminophilum]AHM56291.1 phosphoenolpyruvate synthase PpsA [Peptoclostridium acidaminophilum DSM 3953]
MLDYKYIKWFSEIDKNDIPLVGGKGANLGELVQHKIAVPPGFCVTAEAYKDFIMMSNLSDDIAAIIGSIQFENTTDLQIKSSRIRDLIIDCSVPQVISSEIERAYEAFSSSIGISEPEIAVRSSATAEDLPDASFAGQQDTYLNVFGGSNVVEHVKKCWASLWTARAVYYREQKGFDHFEVSLSAIVQKMVNSEKAGVMFTINPVTHNPDEIMINASWGLGESVVSGAVTPDDYIVDKSSLVISEKRIAEKLSMVVRNKSKLGTVEVSVSDALGHDKINAECLTSDEVLELAKSGIEIENIYGTPQDIEWAFDGDTRMLYILQARPVTALDEKSSKPEAKPVSQKLNVLVKGLGASPGVVFGAVVKIKDMSELSKVKQGDILVAAMTNPDMVPAMRIAAAVVTDEGGRTCHAAIVSRELGIPCIVGSKNATVLLSDGQEVTVDATRGIVYEGRVELETKQRAPEKAAAVPSVSIDDALSKLSPVTGTKIYMNLGEPEMMDKYKNLSFDGIGLMRIEFIFSNMIGAHPMYLIKTGQEEFFIDKLAEGISTVAQAAFPRPVVVRLSDFRTNEFRGLKGGNEVEPVENNPMIGWRGVARYISPEYEQGFRLECRALKKAREEFGLTNIYAMLPFVRTTWEVEKVKEIMASEGLVQDSSFKIWIMAEVPSVVFAADEFAQLVDGFSIGSNDLTQLIMGADRDSGILSRMGYFEERAMYVKRAIQILIDAAHRQGKTISICGQAPSLYPEFTEFLVNAGMDSISVNPDTVEYTRRLVASTEQRIILNKLRSL